jgi:hypothetical protein
MNDTFIPCVLNYVYEPIVTSERNVLWPRNVGQTTVDENVISLE